MSRILAVDYGSRRVGLAVTDPQQIIASPLQTIATRELMPFLKKYLLEENVKQVVVGYPLKDDGSPTDATPLIEAFLKKLSFEFPKLRIHTQDESYTSRMAVRSMIVSGVKKKNRKKKSNLDKISATLILQSFLEDITLSP